MQAQQQAPSHRSRLVATTAQAPQQPQAIIHLREMPPQTREAVGLQDNRSEELRQLGSAAAGPLSVAGRSPAAKRAGTQARVAAAAQPQGDLRAGASGGSASAGAGGAGPQGPWQDAPKTESQSADLLVKATCGLTGGSVHWHASLREV